MAHDPFAVLLRLRGMTLNTARRMLAERIVAEAAATTHAATLDAARAREIALQYSQTAEMWVVDPIAAWHRKAQHDRHAAEDAARIAAAATADARATMNEARVAVRSVEAAIEYRATRRHSAAARTEQAALDEAGAARGPGRDGAVEGVERVTGIEPA